MQRALLIHLVATMAAAWAIGPAYKAELKALASSGVNGMAFVTTTSDGKVAYAGWISGVGANLKPSVCTATNACGAHIHNGTSCADITSQGGHHYGRVVDPWLAERYTSGKDGVGSFGSVVAIGTTDVAGKTFLIHDKFGNRVACGIMTPIDESDLLVAVSEADPGKEKLVQIDGSGVSGSAIVYHQGQTDYVCFAGNGTNLERNLNSSSRDCRATNGCGSHIHAGASCLDIVSQGGQTDLVVDPWLTAGYKTTNGRGVGHFVGCLKTGEEDFEGKPFVLHDNRGVRVACGMLRRTEQSKSEACGPFQTVMGWFIKVMTLGSVRPGCD